ncbi:CxC2 domain-containing protein [Favolaschia claudopus]|uniref:CxC2 domain-containing protein n=1 Tax=Favolaschia claudopus TaxID=2862362 RepID=A0AAW0C0W0_9AGAR
MAAFNVSPTRAPNTKKHIDSYIDYESRSGDLTSDSSFQSSQDGRRKRMDALNLQPKKRKIRPSDLDDTLSGWVPLRDDNTGAREESDEEGDEEELEGAGGKRKRYDSSDDPMKLWRPLADLFLDELLRHEALPTTSKCACCAKPWGPAARKFRCKACGMFVQCADCVLERHQLSPLHSLEVRVDNSTIHGPDACRQEWSGKFWTATSLCGLGFVYQLGHGGFPCPRPAPAVRDMVVMDFPAIHSVKLRYCGCDLSDHANNLQQLLRNGWYPATTVDPGTCATLHTLDIFRMQNVVGNLTVHDAVRVMERCTDATRVKGVPDRYKAFGRMSRQFSFLKRLQRAGRAHDARGVTGTRAGECALLCWACPQDGMNLPQGWRDVSPEFQFLYMLILAVDANFHMRNRLRANQRDDPPLGDGWAYMLEEHGYYEHLQNYVGEEDVSTCIAFQALLQKDTRITTGLRCSGVGGVVCARHELVRAQGVGDLQKGERYSNMDYIVLSAVLGILALWLAISYDIACQWRIYFPKRMENMPERLRLDLTKITLLFALPVWHAAAHERSCQAQNSLTYTKGVGRTDGEGIERTWSRFNTLGWASREMARGARADAIDDRLDHHNWEKNISLGTTLPHKLVVAIEERDRQVAGFEQVDSSLEEGLREEWQAMVDAWVSDRDQPNPYVASKTENVSETTIRRELAKEELEEAAALAPGRKLHGTSMSAFLVMGLQLESQQSRIRRELRHRPLLVADQTERISQMRRSFFVKLVRFRRLQAVYIPGAVELLMEDEDSRDSELPAPEAEDVSLYLPSGLPAARRAGCSEKILQREARLREGQLGDGIGKLRRALLSRTHLWDWKDVRVRGQRAGTRSAVLSQRVEENIQEIAKKYRSNRRALIALRGADKCEEWKELREEDIRGDDIDDVDAGARRRLGRVGSSTRERYRSKVAGRKQDGGKRAKKQMSWIWTSGGGPGEDEGELREAVRIEWSRAQARRDRWTEEVMLLREEMKRVLRFLHSRAIWWEERLVVEREVREDVRAGLRAYAARQASTARAIARRFRSMWDTAAAEVVRAALEDEAGMVPGEGEEDVVQSGDEGEDTAFAEMPDAANRPPIGKKTPATRCVGPSLKTIYF